MATKTKERTTTVRPLDDRILLQPAEAEERTTAGIYLPETAKEKPMQGEVIAAGPGKYDDEGNRTPVSVKKGDKVIYGKYSGTEVEIDGEKYVIVRESELLAKVEG